MSGNLFIPKMKHVSDIEEPTPSVAAEVSSRKSTLLRVAQYIVIALFGLLPIFFTPHLWASLGFDKVILTVGLGLTALVLISFQSLRQTHALTVVPTSLWLYWLVVVAACVSAYLTGNAQDAIWGSLFETQTVAFLGLIGLSMTIPLVFQNSKEMTLKALTFFGLTASILLVYNIVRIFIRAEFLNLQSFGAITVSPVGVFNDLAIFCGLVIVFSLVTLVQLPLKAKLQYFISGLVVMSLFLLAIINFFNVWIVVGLFSFLLIMYLLAQDTIFRSEEKTQISNSRVLFLTTSIVCAFSILFIVAGGFVGGKISQLTGINYIEVRPSTLSMVKIARSVLADNAMLGVGPNRFADAWRQYKDPSINETLFWDTEFIAGSGYIPSLVISLGLLGSVLLFVSHITFLYLGYKMLLRTKRHDSYWYYVGIVSFTSATFVWGMSYMYVPGSSLLLIAAFFTGLTFVAAGALLPATVKTIPLVTSRQRGFLLMTIVILVVIGSVSFAFSTGKQYTAQANFTKANVNAGSIVELEQASISSYGLYQDDRFVSTIAQIQLMELNRLLSIQEPTESDLQKFSEVSNRAIQSAEQAVAENGTNASYRAILAGVYNNLAIAGVDGARDRANAALAEAKRLDALNPGYHLMEAQMATRIGDMPKARESIKSALALKRNYTDALFLSAQLDINEGNTESAIATTRSMITLEPNNPTRYFQLGILLSANNNAAEAEAAFKAAITIDPQYANARYLLSLLYLNTERKDLALEQLRSVQQTNQDNVELKNFIQQVESGQYQIPNNSGLQAPVSETAPSNGAENTVTTETDPKTDLVKSVNTVSDNEDSPESVPKLNASEAPAE